MVNNPKIDAQLAAGLILAGRKTGSEKNIVEEVNKVFPGVKEITDRAMNEFFKPYEDKGELPPWESSVAAADLIKELIKESKKENKEESGDGPPDGGGRASDKDKGKGKNKLPAGAPINFDKPGEKSEELGN